MKHTWNLKKGIQKNSKDFVLNFNIGHLHNIYMQIRIVGYLQLVGAMFRYAESHLFLHHSMFRLEY